MLNKILSAVIVVMVASCLAVQAKTGEEDVNLKTGLVLYMPLDEGKGTSVADVSTNALTGTVKGKAKWIDGKFGKSLQFAGSSDHVLIGDEKVFHIEGEITQAAWVKLDKLPGSHAVIFGTREGGGGRNIGFGYGMNPGNGIKVWTNGKAGGFKDINDNKTKLKIGQWYYLAYTHTTGNGGLVRIFVNGTATHEEESKNPVLPAGKTGAVQIGTWGGEAWPGAVDEVRLWNRALNDAEIKFSMQLGAKEFATPVEPKNKLAVTWSQVKSSW
ncbi:MAG TPA: LamG domain-containing protein [Rhodospirillales bacterium]|nr:LamG domain-containing protein [Rhodospirillales bacterium]